MSEYSLCLFPLIFMAIIGIIFDARTGVKWTYAQCTKNLLILFVTIYGITVGSLLWAIIAWSMYLGLVFLPALIVSRITTAISLLQLDRAMNLAKINYWLLWGPPSTIWIHICQLTKDYAVGDQIGIELTLAKVDAMHPPLAVKMTIKSYVMLGKLFARDWQGIINDWLTLNEKKPAKSAISSQSALFASRAYGEMGEFEKAMECLTKADIEGQSSRHTDSSLQTTFLFFFSLIGAQNQIERLLNKLSKGKQALPAYARLIWLGRCYAAQGNYEQAIKIYQESMAATPSNLSSWKKKCEGHINDAHIAAENNTVPLAARLPIAEKNALVEQAERILNKALLVRNLIAGSGKSPAVTFLAITLVIMFVIAKLHIIFTYRLGILYADAVWHGEYWRLITHAFLHANLIHLLFNVLALLWFGKMIERAFGSLSLIFLFVFSAVMGGLANVLLCPEQAALGASGAIMGIFGATAAVLIRLKSFLPANIRNYQLRWIIALAILQIFLDQVINLFAQMNDPNGASVRIASAAHIGGMVSGFLLALLLPMKKIDSNQKMF